MRFGTNQLVAIVKACINQLPQKIDEHVSKYSKSIKFALLISTIQLFKSASLAPPI